MTTSRDAAPLVHRGSDVPAAPVVSVCLPVMAAVERALGCIDSLSAVMQQGWSRSS